MMGQLQCSVHVFWEVLVYVGCQPCIKAPLWVCVVCCCRCLDPVHDPRLVSKHAQNVGLMWFSPGKVRRGLTVSLRQTLRLR